MEPRSALAECDAAEDHYTLQTTSQNPHLAHLLLSAFYQVDQGYKWRVIGPEVGGRFGSKIYDYPEEIVCLWAAKMALVGVLQLCLAGSVRQHSLGYLLGSWHGHRGARIGRGRGWHVFGHVAGITWAPLAGWLCRLTLLGGETA